MSLPLASTKLKIFSHLCILKAHHWRLFIDFVNFVIVILSVASTCFCRISKANFIPNKDKRDCISLLNDSSDAKRRRWHTKQSRVRNKTRKIRRKNNRIDRFDALTEANKKLIENLSSVELKKMTSQFTGNRTEMNPHTKAERNINQAPSPKRL